MTTPKILKDMLDATISSTATNTSNISTNTTNISGNDTDITTLQGDRVQKVANIAEALDGVTVQNAAEPAPVVGQVIIYCVDNAGTQELKAMFGNGNAVVLANDA